MKKRLFSLAMAFVMCLSLLPAPAAEAAPAESEYPTAPTFSFEGATAVDHSNIDAMKAPGSYYLTEDLTLDSSLQLETPDGTYNINLNGHDIKLRITGSVLGHMAVIKAGPDITLNIFDDPNTSYQGADGRTRYGYWNDNSYAITSDNAPGRDTLTGGCITQAHIEEHYNCGIMVGEGSTLNLVGGNIVGNNFKGFGAGISFLSASLSNLSTSRFHMFGGTVAGNQFVGRGHGCGGVGLQTVNSYIAGGHIINNRVPQKDSSLSVGGLRCTTGTLTMNGKVDISGNTLAGEKSDIYLDEEKALVIGEKFSTDKDIYIDGAIDTNLSFQLTQGANEDITASFKKGTPDESIVLEEIGKSNHNLRLRKTVVPLYKDTLKNDLFAEGVLPKGAYRLMEDITLTSPLIVERVNVTLDLNGHILTAPADNRVLKATGFGTQLTIVDSAPDVLRWGKWEDSGYTIKQQDTAPGEGWTELRGGIITGGKADNGGAILNIQFGGCVNLNGGNIAGNSATGNGGAIYSSSSLFLNGGKIVDNHATGSGGGIYTEANVDLFNLHSPVVIKGNTAGTPSKPNNLYLEKGKQFQNAKELPSGIHIEIGISMQTPGQFVKERIPANITPFFSDNIDYYVNYDNAPKLEARSAISGPLTVADPAAPMPGAEAVNQLPIPEGDGYTAAVTWTPEPAGGRFEANTEYTATVTLTPKPNGPYKFAEKVTVNNEELIRQENGTLFFTKKFSKTGSGTITMEGWTYGEDAKQPHAESTTNPGDPTYTYYTDAGLTTKTSTAADKGGATIEGGRPVNAGTYYVAAELPANDHYGKMTLSTDFTIAPKEISLQWKNLTTSYTGSAQKPVVTPLGVLEADKEQVSVSTDSKTAAGSYELTGTLTGVRGSNYTPSNPKNTFTIQRAPVKYAITGNVVEHGAPLSPVITAIPDVSDTVVYYNSQNEVVATPTEVGTYQIRATITDPNYRHADASDGAQRTIGVLTIYQAAAPAPTAYTVTFEKGDESVTGDAPAGMAEALPGTVRVLPDTTMTKTGHAFAGWRYNGHTYLPGQSFVQPEANVVMKAVWQTVYTVSGEVKQDEAPVEGAVVTLMLGSTQVEQVISAADGSYTFANPVAPGLYNLSASFNGITRTVQVEITNAHVSDKVIELPSGKTNSIVEVKEGTPDLVVDKLDDIFNETSEVFTPDDQATVTGGGSVEFKFAARKETEKDTTAQKAIQAKSKNVGLFLDLTLQKTVTPKDASSTTTTVTESPVLLEATIWLPAHLQNKAGYSVLRYHGSEVQTLTTTANDQGEKIVVGENGERLTIYAKNFSTYAVAYNDTVPTPPTPGPSGGGSNSPSGGSSRPSGYQVEVLPAPNGNLQPVKHRISGGDRVEMQAQPDDGFVVSHVLVTDEKGNTVPVTLGEKGKFSFTMPDSHVTVQVIFAKSAQRTFLDVKPSDYFHGPVMWAVEKGITDGTSWDTFSPNLPCTRGQMAQFLWKVSGSPEPAATNTRFVDVPTDAYYAKAVAWAVEQGVTVGTSATTYSPDSPTTRAQMATFLYRLNKAKAEAKAGIFEDVAVDAWYAQAVRWAVDEGITVGTSKTTYSPDAPCTRGQMVTFLWRMFGK